MQDVVCGVYDEVCSMCCQVYLLLIYDDFGNGFIMLQMFVMCGDCDYFGLIVVVFLVEGILKYDILQELLLKYKILIIDLNNCELLFMLICLCLLCDFYYDLLFDLFGQGLMVCVYVFLQFINLINNIFVWFVVGLLCFVLWSFWSLWKYMCQCFEVQQVLYVEVFFCCVMENLVLIGMCVFDMYGCIMYVNFVFCWMMGWDEIDFVGKVVLFLYWLCDVYLEMQCQFDMMLCGKVLSLGFELCVWCKNGMLFYVCLYVLLLIDSLGCQIGWMLLMIDIIELKCVCEEFVVVYECFMMVFESFDVVVLVFVVDEVELLFVNCYYCYLFGICLDGYLELLGGGFDCVQVLFDLIDMVDVFVGLLVVVLMSSIVDVQEVYVESIQKWFEVCCQYIQWVDGYFVQMQIVIDIMICKKVQEFVYQQEEKLQFMS